MWRSVQARHIGQQLENLGLVAPTPDGPWDGDDLDTLTMAVHLSNQMRFILGSPTHGNKRNLRKVNPVRSQADGMAPERSECLGSTRERT